MATDRVGVGLPGGYCIACREQCLAQLHRLGSLRGRQIHIAAAHRQTVRLADDGANDDLDVDVQIFDHPPQYRGLLVILPAEERGAWADDVQEFADHGANAAEVARSARSTHCFGEVIDFHERLEAGSVHLVRRRCEDHIHTHLPACFRIGIERLWVRIEILVGAELRRVDEDADDDEIARGPRGFDQRQMPRVQSSHRRHEADASLGVACGRHGVTDLGDCMDYFHDAISPIRPAVRRRFFPCRGRWSRVRSRPAEPGRSAVGASADAVFSVRAC